MTGPARATRDRLLFRVACALTVAPIFIDALRSGRQGWVPTFAAAHTVMVAKFSLGRDPVLTGMYTDAAKWIDAPTFFPGP